MVVMQEDAPTPIDGVELGPAYKRLTDDIRNYYIEAAIARPDGHATDLKIANWLYGETMLGKVMIAVRDWAMDSEEPSIKPLALRMLPTHQRHRGRHG